MCLSKTQKHPLPLNGFTVLSSLNSLEWWLQSQNRLGLGHSESQTILKSYHWYNSYGDFATCVDFAYWRSCMRKGLRLQPVQQACLSRNTASVVLRNYLLLLRQGNCPCNKIIYVASIWRKVHNLLWFDNFSYLNSNIVYL